MHAATYLTVLTLLGTGWWFVLGHYRPSVVAELTGVPDGAVHEYTGFALAAVVLAGTVAGRRGVRTFVVESIRVRRGDGRWFRVWPRAVFTGRFAEHDGHFDPGQRLANIVMVLALACLVLSGFGLLYVSWGPMLLIHRWATFLITPVLAGHVLIGAGVLPGYRGVWRSMHLGGRLPASTARRIWPHST